MYWQQRFDRVDPDLQIRIAIEDIRKDHPNYGYRRLLPLLRSRGIVVNKKRLQRIMQKFNLQVIAIRPLTPLYELYFRLLRENAITCRLNFCIIRCNRFLLTTIPRDRNKGNNLQYP